MEAGVAAFYEGASAESTGAQNGIDCISGIVDCNRNKAGNGADNLPGAESADAIFQMN